ncbi:sensor histidine kinase [Rhodobacteraceae bacterium RKSG542]|uniref:sensor histidine kinase n=1 Tax=Pseudovibrio flavus TaxID=2529854 RepID=UPI0012BBF5FC|nr:ATP-binding protein [Pseudovibrio flavus]MTI16791.1 sensor histidine kinase [Pseudovibrio flavus]
MGRRAKPGLVRTKGSSWENLTGLLIIVLIVVVIGAAWLTMRVSESIYLKDLEVRGEATLAVQTASLEKHLNKYRLLPPLLSRSSEVINLLALRDKEAASRFAKLIAGMSGAQEVWVHGFDGNFSVSNLVPEKALGAVDPARFSEAYGAVLQGRLGRQLVMNGPNEPASYVFASPVRSEGKLLGLVGVRVSLADVEQAWALSKDGLMAVDEAGRIVATNISGWRGRVMEPVTGTVFSEVGQDNVLYKRQQDRTFNLIELPMPLGPRPRLEMAQELPVFGWSVMVLSDTTQVRQQAARATISAILLCIVGLGLLWVLAERRRQLVERIRQDRLAARKLEERVNERTQELTTANLRLEDEVREREQAEFELQRVQAGLIQSAKLATLGEMSAALSHEFNQPLGAIRTHAENAQIYIDSGRAEKAEKSLGRIVSMVERLAQISRSLKGFTRKAGSDVSAVAIGPVVDEVLMLIGPRCKQMNVALDLQLPDKELQVKAGQVRLSQVLMNLISNALDAMKGQVEPRLAIKAEQDREMLRLSVEDSGTGVDESIVSQIFDPFFTTKDVGEGLGLGLSIAYKIMRDFEGDLTYSRSSLGGSCFTMELRLCSDVAEVEVHG